MASSPHWPHRLPGGSGGGDTVAWHLIPPAMAAALPFFQEQRMGLHQHLLSAEEKAVVASTPRRQHFSG